MDKGNNRIKGKIVLGMSGGVDSTASALLLQKQGFEVTGLYFDVQGKGRAAAKKAEAAAAHLGIPFIYKDISKEFSTKIISYFYNEYLMGRTPNPCVLCNKEIKYKVLLDAADSIGAKYIATGHYASTAQLEEPGETFVKICANRKKDQSYVLWRLGQEELSRIIFPLNSFDSKEEIRELLRENGFENSEDKDSQEICFIENDDYISFLTEKMGMKPKIGNFVNKEGKILGKHAGIIRYTVGQRKGLGITFGKPVFVTEIDSAKNQVVLGDDEDLKKNRIISSSNNFCSSKNFFGKQLQGKIRYAAAFADCEIRQLPDGRIETIFEMPQRAPTPGQSIVWYWNDLLIGGGIIDKI